jgi:alpha-tubulin suppressor-like RCC1 family protein
LTLFWQTIHANLPLFCGGICMSKFKKGYLFVTLSLVAFASIFSQSCGSKKDTQEPEVSTSPTPSSGSNPTPTPNGGTGTGGNTVLPVALANTIKVYASESSTCALSASGSVSCWGDNTYEAVGFGTSASLQYAQLHPTLTSGVSSLSFVQDGGCAILSGAVKCWGSNTGGLLATGNTIPSRTPIAIASLSSGISYIVSGQGHSCALTTTGAAKCWGYSNVGQIGDGSTSNRFLPVNVPTLSFGVSNLVAGALHSCAINSTGQVKCWGYGTEGALGNGTTSSALVASDVPGLSTGIASLTAGNSHTCATTTAGAVKCWGKNNLGQLGDGSNTTRLSPVNLVSLSSGISKVVSGPFSNHTCGLTTGGGVKCWGDGTYGALGQGANTSSSVPVDVVGLSSGVVDISMGNSFTCAALANGSVKCWGSNLLNEIGDSGAAGIRNMPVLVRTLPL